VTARVFGVLCFLTALVGPAAIRTAAEEAEHPQLKVGMVSDGGKFDDAGFNQNCKEGLERAMAHFKVYGFFRESFSPKDHLRNLAALAGRDYALILGIGDLMKDAMAAAARKHPQRRFAMVDGVYDPPLPNVRSLSFQVDEAAFPAGYLAAAWADLKDPADPMVGFVGGMRIETVEQFTEPFAAGVKYYSEKNNRPVTVRGLYAERFTDFKAGKKLGAELIAAGADVVFAAGSLTGNGALAAAKEHGKWGVGVDVDQYYSLLDEQDILITSVVKKMDNAVYAVVKDLAEGKFEGGTLYVGTLANDGVGLAPFHNFEPDIPERIKQDLIEIQDQIKSGKLKTGWRAK